MEFWCFLYQKRWSCDHGLSFWFLQNEKTMGKPLYTRIFQDYLLKPAYLIFYNNQVSLLSPPPPLAPHLPLNGSQSLTRWVGRGQWSSGWVVVTFPGQKPNNFSASCPSFLVTGNNNTSEQLLSALKLYSNNLSLLSWVLTSGLNFPKCFRDAVSYNFPEYLLFNTIVVSQGSLLKFPLQPQI